MTIELFQPLTKPTAAQLNAIGDNQVALDAIYLGAEIEDCVQLNGADNDRWMLRHVHRWLLYDSTGTLEDVSGVNDPVSLPDAPTGQEALLDLDTVSWLQIGVIYRVTGCTYAMERKEALNA